jgi:hypothetical protein
MNPEEDHILRLMEVFDRVDSSFRQVETFGQAGRWLPITDVERNAFAALVAPENRGALKTWYSSGSSLNPHADLFRRVLERAIGEDLPLATRANG